MNNPLLSDPQKADDIALLASDSGGPDLFNVMIDGQLLQREAHTRPARIPVRVIRYMFIAHAMASAAVMIFSYFIYYALSFDADGRSGARLFFMVASVVGMALFYAMLVIMVAKEARSFAIPVLCAFLACVVAFAGALSAVARNITPLQAATMCFAQSLSVYGYTLSSPDGIDAMAAAIYMIFAALGVWFVGLYGFIVQQAWLSSGLLFFFGALSSLYLSVQVYFAHRYSLSDADCQLALVQFYTDPVMCAIQWWWRARNQWDS